MSRDTESSAELDRVRVILACSETMAEITRRRADIREKNIRWAMRQRTWLRIKLPLRTRAEAEMVVDKALAEFSDPFWGAEHNWMHHRQFERAGLIMAMAAASKERTVRLTLDDFETIRVGWENSK